MKKLLTILLVALLALSMTACGKKEEPKQDVELTVWVGENYVTVTEEMAKAFAEANADKANIKITVAIESESTCKDTVLKDPTAAADVYTFADDQLLDLVNGKAIQAVNDVDYVTSTIGAGSVDAATVDGTLYAYPMSASNGYFLYYDASFFTQDDITSLNTMAAKAAASGKHVDMQFGADGGWYIYSFFKGAGLNMHVNEDGQTNMCDWDCEKGQQVCQAILDLVKTNGFIAASDGDMVNNAKEGNAVAIINGTWNSGAMQQAYGDNYACAKLPTYTLNGTEVQMGSFAGYKLIGVNPYSKNVGWAMEFAKYMISEENQVKRFEAVGDGPSNVKAAANEKVLANQAIAALAAQSAYATVQRVGNNYWTPAAALGTILSQGNPDGTPLADLLSNAVAGITAPVQ